MRVQLRLTRSGETLGELDLLPSNLRRLTRVDYLGTEYEVVSQFTTVVKGEPLAILDVRRVRT